MPHCNLHTLALLEKEKKTTVFINRQLSSHINRALEVIEQIHNLVEHLHAMINIQMDAVKDSSAVTEEMVGSLKDTSELSREKRESIKQLIEHATNGQEAMKETVSAVQTISESVEGIGSAIKIISVIASNTNLLSMNAAIEAAHAGEAGKGFAVVADEIRKLAESSSEQSKTIGTVLKKIAESIKKITGSTDNVLAKFEAIDSSVKTVSLQEENIRNAMEEQGEGSKQLLQSAGNLNETTQRVKTGSGEMLEGSREVMNESKNLEKLTQEITGGMNEMTSGAEQVNIAVHHVSEMSGKNSQAIETLLEEVSRFKV